MSSQKSKERKEEKVEEKGLQAFLTINSYTVIPMFPHGHKIGILRSASGGPDFIVLQFFTLAEQDVEIPLGTYLLTKNMVKSLIEALSKYVKELEKSQEKE